MDKELLRTTLIDLDGAGYGSYKSVKGVYEFGDFSLHIDYIQGDPFAAPSNLRIKIPISVCRIPLECFSSKPREIATRDFFTRSFFSVSRRFSKPCGSGKSGIVSIDRPGQEVIDRSSAFVNEKELEVRFVVGLPANGRRIKGRSAAKILCDYIPKIVKEALYFDSIDGAELKRFAEVTEDADWLRGELKKAGLVSFVADESLLPRLSGVDDRPLGQTAVVFKAPPQLKVEFIRPNLGRISGLGIPHGVTLIVGGGYHGKSTLLRAIECGVYNHIPGDGREFVVTDPNAVKIRSEDGRSVASVTISPFISNLPNNCSTDKFSSTFASGSTSQAAGIVEAIEAGATTLLMDEDTSATNFMIRDHRMQELISKKKEPITPFTDKIRHLLDEGVSTVLVMGGCGDYFDVADTVIAMENYSPCDVSIEAKEIAKNLKTGRQQEGGKDFGRILSRIPKKSSFKPGRGKRETYVRTRSVDEITFGEERIDLTFVEQLVHESQMRAIAEGLVYALKKYIDGKRTVAEIISAVEGDISLSGLDILSSMPVGDLAVFRKFEFVSAINRLRTLEVE